MILILLTSFLTGSEIRTMWMTPFYLFYGVLLIYIFKPQINLKNLKAFSYGFLFLFFLSPLLYAYISVSQTDKRTDYPGNLIASKIQLIWDQDFSDPIQFVIGDEWKAGNLSYHLKSRPRWEGFINDKILEDAKEYLCIDDVCVGTYK